MKDSWPVGDLISRPSVSPYLQWYAKLKNLGGALSSLAEPSLTTPWQYGIKLRPTLPGFFSTYSHMLFSIGRAPNKQKHLTRMQKLKEKLRQTLTREKLRQNLKQKRLAYLQHLKRYVKCMPNPRLLKAGERMGLPNLLIRSIFTHSIFVGKPSPTWLLIPASVAVTDIISHGTNICSVLAYIAAQSKKPPPFPPTSFSKRFGFPTTFGAPVLLKESARVAKKNQRVIMAFRNLALRWLAPRIRPGNDDDLVTCEAPKHPITLMAWRERRTYSFEPSTIQRDMCERLLMTIYSVPAYLPPRNPYTNLPLRTEQFYSVLQQLRRAGKSHWVLEAYGSVQCNMDAYKKQFDEALSLETTRRQFNNLSCPDVVEMILDFIQDEHLAHKAKYNDVIYRWALETRPSMPRIQRWIQLCKKDALNLMTVEQITVASRELCRHPTELEEQRTAAESSSADPSVTHRAL